MATAKADLVLESQEDVRNVQELKQRLADLLAKPKKKALRLDAEQVERIDASALQLLTAFHIALQAQGRSVAWIAPSDALLRSAHSLGLSAYLDLETPEATAA